MENVIAYKTERGQSLIGDCFEILNSLQDESIDLIVTSPPFALEGRKKSYGNLERDEYIDWLTSIAQIAYKKLKHSGSFVLDLGGVYNKGNPTYSLYQFRILIKFCDELGYNLAQPFYWHNSSALPAPIEWVNKKKIRAKNSVNTIWWFSKTPNPKANISNVLSPYSKRMQKLIENPSDFVKVEGVERPSGYVMSKSSWTKNNGGSIPPNLLQYPNSDSNSQYLRFCKQCQVKAHPARFPLDIPTFFIKFLTDENDLVVDIFAGSNTTGKSAEQLNRKWLSIELNREYAAAGCFRFCNNAEMAKDCYDLISSGKTITFD